MIENKKQGLCINKTLLFAMYIIAPLTGLLPNYITLIGVVETILLLVMVAYNKDYYLCMPIFLLFADHITIGTFRVYNIYFIVMILTAMSKDFKLKIKKKYLPYLIAVILTSVYLIDISPRLAITTAIVIIGVIIYLSSYFTDPEFREEIFKYNFYATTMAAIYGIFAQAAKTSAIIIDGEWVYYQRFLGTFEDMNYWGMFVNIALAIGYLNSRIKLPIRISCLLVLYYGLFASTSFTAYLVHIVVIVAVLIVNGISAKKVAIIVATIAILSLFIPFAMSHDLGAVSTALHDAYNRVVGKMAQSDNLSEFTTGRSSNAVDHLIYLFSRSPIRMIFGGDLELAVYNQGIFSYIAHNEHISVMMTCGIFGWICVEYVYMSTYFEKISALYKPKGFLNLAYKKNVATTLIVKSICLIYTFALSMFMGWRFAIFLLL